MLNLQTKNVPLARFLYVFSLQIMSAGSERRKIEGSNSDPRLKQQTPPMAGFVVLVAGAGLALALLAQLRPVAYAKNLVRIGIG